MRLLHTETRLVQDFADKAIPTYAILSHRWEEDEVSFEEICYLNGDYPVSPSKGYTKIDRLCITAAADGFEYVWIDTCCIDKRSSAELSEAINSMFRWYQNSAVCYVYLSDVRSNAITELLASRWFKRGWTLQELIAPRHARFFAHDWTHICDKHSILDELEASTRVPMAALTNFESRNFLVAEKMSWSVGRVTTREEDAAYSMLGIFDINIPLLYGEGPKAFFRLQLAIMENSADLSLFAWSGNPSPNYGMLAADPSGFCLDLLGPKSQAPRKTYSLSNGWSRNNAGILVELDLQPLWRTRDDRSIFVAWLSDPNSMLTPHIGIFLEKRNLRSKRKQYRRVTVDGETTVTPSRLRESRPLVSPPLEEFFILSESIKNSTSTGQYTFTVSWTDFLGLQVQVRQRPLGKEDVSFAHWPVLPPPDPTSFQTKVEPDLIDMLGIIGFMIIRCSYTIPLLVGFGFDERLLPMCLIVPCLFDHATLQSKHLVAAYRTLRDSDTKSNKTENEIFDQLTHAYLIRSGEESRQFSLYKDHFFFELSPRHLRVKIAPKISDVLDTMTHKRLGPVRRDGQRKLFGFVD